MLFAASESGSNAIAVIAFLFIFGLGIKKMFSIIPTDIKSTAKDSIIDRIRRWGK